MTKKKLATLTAYAAAAILAAVQWSTGSLANGPGATATAAALSGQAGRADRPDQVSCLEITCASRNGSGLPPRPVPLLWPPT
jgi:hypothetical protein